jgi:hypothetical protein
MIQQQLPGTNLELNRMIPKRKNDTGPSGQLAIQNLNGHHVKTIYTA